MKCQLSEIHGAGRIEKCLFITFLEALQDGVKINGNNRISRLEVSVKKVFLKNMQNSQKNTYVRVSFLIKLQA